MGDDIMELHSAADGQPSTFSYIGQHRYHVTLPVHGEEPVFTSPDRVTPVLDVLRESGRAHAFEVFAYCFLPEQLQLLIRGRRETSDMRAFLSEFRTGSSAVVQPVLGQVLWRKKYLERVLRKGEDILAVARRMLKEPVKRGLAATPKDYAFAGSFVVDGATLTEPSFQGGPHNEAPGGAVLGGEQKDIVSGTGSRERFVEGPRRKFGGRGGSKFRAGSGRKHSGPPGSHGGREFRQGVQRGYPHHGPPAYPGRTSSGYRRPSRFGRPPSGPPGRSAGGFSPGHQAGFVRKALSGGESPTPFGQHRKGGGGFQKRSSHGFSRKPPHGYSRKAGHGPPGEGRSGFRGGQGRGRFGKPPTSPRGKRGPRRGFRPGGRRSSPGTGTS
jgi:REP element-mobilizing transposase RayT